MQDRDAISECLKGERSAFEHLVQRYQASVLATAWSILRDRDEARDAAQDAFIQAYANLERFDQERDFKKWLLGIAAKRCLDRLRRRKSFRNFLGKYGHQVNDVLADPVAAAADFPCWEKISARLNPRERSALWLSVYEDLAVAEIAVIMGCAENTVRVHLFHARKKLRQEVSDHV